MKSIIKMLGLSLGCSCTALQAQQNAAANTSEKDAVIVSSVIADETPPSTLSSLQDIGKIYAL